VREKPSDTVVLRVPSSRASIPLLRLVIGGVAARMNVGVDQLDDLQLAVETLVVEERSYAGDLVLEIAVKDRGMFLRLDGLRNRDVRDLLLEDARTRPVSAHPVINVRMLLNSLVDAFAVADQHDGGFAVQMEKWAS